MNESSYWRVAHESDVFPYYFERTDLAIPKMSGFIHELWDELAKANGKTIIVDDCTDCSTNKNEMGQIGQQCISHIEDGSDVTLIEGTYMDRDKMGRFRFHAIPVFSAQVRFYEVSEYTTNTTLDIFYFLFFGIPELVAIAIGLILFRHIRSKRKVSTHRVFLKLFRLDMFILLVGLTSAMLIYWGCFRGNTVIQAYTSNIDTPKMLEMLRAGTKIFLTAYKGEWEESELDVIIGESNRMNNAYAISNGRVDLLERICDDPRYVAALYPIEVEEARNQNKIRCTLRQIPMTDLQAAALPSPEYFFPMPYFFLLSRNQSKINALIEQIDFLLLGPFNVETLPIWNFHSSSGADRSNWDPPPQLMHAPIRQATLLRLSHLLVLIALFYLICILVFVLELAVSRTKACAPNKGKDFGRTVRIPRIQLSLPPPPRKSKSPQSLP